MWIISNCLRTDMVDEWLFWSIDHITIYQIDSPKKLIHRSELQSSTRVGTSWRTWAGTEPVRIEHWLSSYQLPPPPPVDQMLWLMMMTMNTWTSTSTPYNNHIHTKNVIFHLFPTIKKKSNVKKKTPHFLIYNCVTWRTAVIQFKSPRWNSKTFFPIKIKCTKKK